MGSCIRDIRRLALWLGFIPAQIEGPLPRSFHRRPHSSCVAGQRHPAAAVGRVLMGSVNDESDHSEAVTSPLAAVWRICSPAQSGSR
jgi:hypothetical protein